mmetsp:Transcript_32967/g.52807  ORF Transcript_32967/g.52807 Transcript_32967/m.52807 type:complete len:218 (+) Transcript_32967:2890-3543(+)
MTKPGISLILSIFTLSIFGGSKRLTWGRHCPNIGLAIQHIQLNRLHIHPLPNILLRPLHVLIGMQVMFIHIIHNLACIERGHAVKAGSAILIHNINAHEGTFQRKSHPTNARKKFQQLHLSVALMRLLTFQATQFAYPNPRLLPCNTILIQHNAHPPTGPQWSSSHATSQVKKSISWTTFKSNYPNPIFLQHNAHPPRGPQCSSSHNRASSTPQCLK